MIEAFKRAIDKAFGLLQSDHRQDGVPPEVKLRVSSRPVWRVAGWQSQADVDVVSDGGTE